MKKAIILFGLLVILSTALALTGCTAKSASAPSTEVDAAAVSETAKQLETIQKSGVIKIGTEGTYAPFTFHDPSGKLTGFDVELADEVARRLGVKAQYVETKWDGMFAGLDAKRFDIVVNEVGIRADRQEKYDFSVPYIVSKAVLITHSENNSLKSFKDLNGKKAGQSLTSNFADLARKNGAELVAVEGFNQAMDLLSSKRTEATINDSLSFLDFKKQRPDAPLKIVAEEEKGSESGILIRKGNPELVEAIDKALQAMKDDGTYLKISKKWFGEDVSK